MAAKLTYMLTANSASLLLPPAYLTALLLLLPHCPAAAAALLPRSLTTSQKSDHLPEV